MVKKQPNAKELTDWKRKCCLIAQQWLTGSLLCRQLPECFDWTAPSTALKTASKNLTLPDTIHDMGCSRYDWLSLSYNCWSQTKTGWMACSEVFIGFLMFFIKPLLQGLNCGFHAYVEEGHDFQCLELSPELVYSQNNNEATAVENKARYPSNRLLSLTSWSLIIRYEVSNCPTK